MKTLLTLSAFVPFLLAGCTSESTVRSALQKNPEIIFEIIEKNPEKFVAAAQAASNEYRKVAQMKQQQEAEKEREEEFKNPKTPKITSDMAARGPASAPILIVEYSDFECPYCRRGYQSVEEVRAKYGDKVRFVFKHLPLSFHQQAMPAAKRFEAIAMQSTEKAYKFHDELFKDQQKLAEGEKFMDAVAKKVGADVAKMKKDMESDRVKKRIEADMEEAAKFGINGTPGFIVAGVSLKGAMPASAFEEIIEKKIRELAGK